MIFALLVAFLALTTIDANRLPPMPGAKTPECAQFHHRCALARQSCLPLCQGDQFCASKCHGYYHKCLSTCGKGDRYSGDEQGQSGGGGADMGYDKLRQYYSPLQKLGPMPGARSKECANYHRECSITLRSCTPKCAGDPFCKNACLSDHHYCRSTCGKGDRAIEMESGMADGLSPENKMMSANYGATSVPGGGYQYGSISGLGTIPH
ncbi:hypothetical protein K493DRAFT_384919 [Basidiobolus meristosporus CBS 931.73]|uniref:WAP domain-containing protein n=1 Tax=Basidiobolus meristosporus CBS 931.73 TaxID=1314790 RepID=A0A1Y1XS20_9FUNG|nr:hypothetical protein K493DRAFT_384919 [Basidiobolus meristosporus CBS 931.73]|eukprot:ORX88569.1 hypothetical protein K493DRAFT_384919 [Basidiobolus meristosporus CBS 931.73]